MISTLHHKWTQMPKKRSSTKNKTENCLHTRAVWKIRVAALTHNLVLLEKRPKIVLSFSLHFLHAHTRTHANHNEIGERANERTIHTYLYNVANKKNGYTMNNTMNTRNSFNWYAINEWEIEQCDTHIHSFILVSRIVIDWIVYTHSQSAHFHFSLHIPMASWDQTVWHLHSKAKTKADYFHFQHCVSVCICQTSAFQWFSLSRIQHVSGAYRSCVSLEFKWCC